MSNLIFSLNATMPIFLTMILGLFFRKVGILDESFTSKMNKFLFKICRDLLPFRTEYCKNDNRHDIIQRHTADDHQRRHAGISVDILDKGNTKDRRTAPVRRLDKFASCTSLF